MTTFDLLVRCGFTPEQARALTDGGYQVIDWWPFGWLPTAGGR